MKGKCTIAIMSSKVFETSLFFLVHRFVVDVVRFAGEMV